MREIKFRAWNKKEEFMDSAWLIDWEHGKVCHSKHNQSELDDCVLMQYTSLKDKNDVEIYEGDVLLFNNDYPNAQKMDWKCVVKYRKGSFVCEYPKDGVYNHFDSWNVPKVTWEVIGNIYENPELLEVVK